MDNPIHEQVASRAYQFWEERGQPWGTPEIDWFRAEGELAESALSRMLREVGSVAGRVAVFLSDTRQR
jgi:hypothetical protein